MLPLPLVQKILTEEDGEEVLLLHQQREEVAVDVLDGVFLHLVQQPGQKLVGLQWLTCKEYTQNNLIVTLHVHGGVRGQLLCASRGHGDRLSVAAGRTGGRQNRI